MNKLVTVMLLASARIVSAEPSMPSASNNYVQAGGLFGFDADYPAAALAVEGGTRPTTLPIWVRGLGAWGGQEAGGGHLNAHYGQIRGGLETRACTVAGIVCFLVGIDAGYRQLQTMGDSGQHDGAIVVPRAGLDVGARHVRLRLALDAIYDRTGGDGMLLTGGLGYHW